MIAIVYPQFYGVGGIARYLDSFLSNLPPDHPAVYLISGDEHQLERSYRGVEIIHIRFSSNRLSLLSWGWQVRQLLLRLYAEGKIRLVNLHFPPLISALLLPRKIPVILTVHSTYLGMSGKFYPQAFYASDTNWLSLKIKMWMESRIYANSIGAITLTEFGRSQMLAYGYRKPVAIIPNGVDLQQFTLAEDGKDIDVLFSGRIEHLKGSKGMVALCRQLVAQKTDIRIYIVGYGEEEQWVRQQLADLSGNVIMTGKVAFADMHAYYRRSRVYVSTSYYEGLPGTCLEAMALQLPVVVWDFLFYRGLVREGETGLLAAPNDFAGMTEKVLQLLSDRQLAATMGKNGRALLESDYDWGRLAADVSAVFTRSIAA
jgi:glycosyltransferase involved in cell wall biosynthesis